MPLCPFYMNWRFSPDVSTDKVWLSLGSTGNLWCPIKLLVYICSFSLALFFFLNYAFFSLFPTKFPQLQLKQRLWSTVHQYSQLEQQDLLDINKLSLISGKWHSWDSCSKRAVVFRAARKLKATQLFSLPFHGIWHSLVYHVSENLPQYT